MSAFQIRPAGAEDALAIAATIARYRGELGGVAPPPEAIAEVVCRAIAAADSRVFVASEGADLAGYVAMHANWFPLIAGREAYITDLLVSARWRGQGAGHALLYAAEAAARDLGCTRILLNNRMDSESFTRQFYAKYGYRHRAEFANFIKLL